MTSRDVIIVNDLYCMQNDLSIYNLLLDEIKSCGIPDDQLFKLWHGNQEIEGTHMIADDKTHWKTKCPTFKMVLDKATSFFGTRGSIFATIFSSPTTVKQVSLSFFWKLAKELFFHFFVSLTLLIVWTFERIFTHLVDYFYLFVKLFRSN